MGKFDLPPTESHKPDATQLDINFDDKSTEEKPEEEKIEVKEGNKKFEDDGLDETPSEDLYGRFAKIKHEQMRHVPQSIPTPEKHSKNKKNIYKHRSYPFKNPLFNPDK